MKWRCSRVSEQPAINSTVEQMSFFPVQHTSTFRKRMLLGGSNKRRTIPVIHPGKVRHRDPVNGGEVAGGSTVSDPPDSELVI